ncbi:MAG TPA: glucoamylase family protein [Acidimicrobiia bacterium]|nr:glucoamylase family protein [Acidimicrobiia bacterium]
MTRKLADDDLLERLQRDTLRYFLDGTNPRNGLVPDNTRVGSPSSITAVGFALAAYAVGVDRNVITRSEAIERTLTTLRFFWESPQSDEPDATGYMGFFYHFLDMETGRRAWESELSTIDTTFLLAGVLTAAAYFDRETSDEREIRTLADALYGRVDWQWAQNGGLTVTHGWIPERGFLNYRWEGYSEAILLYVLGLGSPTHPLPETSYAAWTRTYRWKKLYGHEFLYAGPLFIHQLSHVWIDFRGIQDGYMRDRGIDYFENSRRATLVQQQYAIRNPRRLSGYSDHCWGITASDGPGPITRRIDGIERHFYDYKARGIPWGPDDGTIAPWAAVASLPFAPEIVLPTLRHFDRTYPQMMGRYGVRCSFNPTFGNESGDTYGWHSERYFGLDQGPIILMIENYQSDLLWRWMKRCPYLITGLRRAGFDGSWLSTTS